MLLSIAVMLHCSRFILPPALVEPCRRIAPSAIRGFCDLVPSYGHQQRGLVGDPSSFVERLTRRFLADLVRIPEPPLVEIVRDTSAATRAWFRGDSL